MLSLEERVDLLQKIVLWGCLESKLALLFEWDSQTMEYIYQVFDKYMAMCQNENYNFSYIDVEKDLSVKGINYQDAKSIILTFDQLGKYEKVIMHYLQTNYSAHGNVSSEFNGIAHKYLRQ